MPEPPLTNHRQMIYWRLIAAAGGLGEPGASFESMAAELADRLELPSALLDPCIGVDVLLHRYPELIPHFDAVRRCLQPPDAAEPASSKLEPTSRKRSAMRTSSSAAPSPSRSSCSTSSGRTRAPRPAPRPSTASGARTSPPSSAR